MSEENTPVFVARSLREYKDDYGKLDTELKKIRRVL